MSSWCHVVCPCPVCPVCPAFTTEGPRVRWNDQVEALSWDGHHLGEFYKARAPSCNRCDNFTKYLKRVGGHILKSLPRSNSVCFITGFFIIFFHINISISRSEWNSQQKIHWEDPTPFGGLMLLLQILMPALCLRWCSGIGVGTTRLQARVFFWPWWCRS